MLKIKVFVLDYLLSYALIFALFMIIAAQIPVIDTKIEISLSTQCDDTQAAAEILGSASSVLKQAESCNLKLPCTEWQKLECQVNGTSLGSLVLGPFTGDALMARVTGAMKPYGLWAYRDKSILLIPMGIVLMVIIYGFILIKATAGMFALWRQKLLYQTLSFPVTNRRKVLLYPALIAIFCALFTGFLGSALEQIFSWPDSESSSLVLGVLTTPVGVFAGVVLAPFVEELLFRGILLRFFVERGRLILGSIVVSLAFMLFHGLVSTELVWQLFSYASYFLVSLILCWVYIKNRSLWSPIIFHSAYNSVLFLGYFLTR